jgi:hypothetical protein
MKKAIALFALVLCILAGLVSGSLALYTKEIDNIGTGSVLAKKFTLTAEGTEGYEDNVLIAPSETVTAAFTVSNYSGDYVTEVDMDLEIEITIGAATDKYAIPHITAALLDEEGNPITGAVSSVSDGSGTITLTIDRAFEANVKSTLAYKIALTWESHEDDIDFQGPNYGNKYSVKIIGTQSV